MSYNKTKEFKKEKESNSRQMQPSSISYTFYDEQRRKAVFALAGGCHPSRVSTHSKLKVCIPKCIKTEASGLAQLGCLWCSRCFFQLTEKALTLK